jgi:hypothetical protein
MRNVLHLLCIGALEILHADEGRALVKVLAFEGPIRAATRDSSWKVGNPEVILGLNLFGGQVVNAILHLRRIIENRPPTRGRYVIDIKIA